MVRSGRLYSVFSLQFILVLFLGLGNNTVHAPNFHNVYNPSNNPISEARTALQKTDTEYLIDSLNKKPRMWGLDVSKWQGNIKWSQVVKHNKPHFVFLKATEGTHITDPTYKRNGDSLEKYDIMQGAYHFWRFDVPGYYQAKRFINTIKIRPNNLAPVVDVEYGRKRLPSKKVVVEQLMTFCKVIERTYGVKPILYTNEHLYETYLAEAFEDYILWIPKYSTKPKLDWDIWQYTNKGVVKGIEGRVDKNYMRTDKEMLQRVIVN